MTKDKRGTIWQSPWGYAESIVIVVGIILIGSFLQLSIGSFDFFLLANPVNIFTGLALFLISILLGILFRNSSLTKWISGTPLSVSLILAMLSLSIIMGLTPQVAEGVETNMLLGFDSMTTSWPLILIYLFTLISLGSLIFRRIKTFKINDTPFMLNHIGLYIILFAAGLGYADMERYVMYVSEGETQWRVYDAEKNVKELPIAINLIDFDMDVYPPKLAIIDRESGAVQPIEKPQYFQIDTDIKESKLCDYDIKIIDYIHNAVRSSDSTYREVPMPGSTPAIEIEVSTEESTIRGWVSAGSISQAYMTLPLNESQSVVMTQAEPRKFISHVEVYSQDGDNIDAEIVVNSPLRVGSWMIYQYGYDNTMGRLSTYSSFELVYDPWLTPIYLGVILMMLGAVTMIAQGRNRQKKYKTGSFSHKK
ncbi:MAG: cytochrome c biogenesis protein ResB [Rikenellaceae bacterium]